MTCDGWTRLRWDLFQQGVSFFGAKVYDTRADLEKSLVVSILVKQLLAVTGHLRRHSPVSRIRAHADIACGTGAQE